MTGWSTERQLVVTRDIGVPCGCPFVQPGGVTTSKDGAEYGWKTGGCQGLLVADELLPFDLARASDTSRGMAPEC